MKNNFQRARMPPSKIILRFFLILCCAALFTGCFQRHLRIQVDYLSRESLASFHVGTPDPRLLYPPVGQRLILTWTFPKKYANYGDHSIRLTLHFGNYTEEQLWIYPKEAYGVYCYCLANQHYFDKKGLLAYKAELFVDGCLIEEWNHQLWARLITFDNDTCEEKSDRYFELKQRQAGLLP